MEWGDKIEQHVIRFGKEIEASVKVSFEIFAGIAGPLLIVVGGLFFIFGSLIALNIIQVSRLNPTTNAIALVIVGAIFIIAGILLDRAISKKL